MNCPNCGAPTALPDTGRCWQYAHCATPTNRRELARRIACPSCGHPMLTDWYYGPGNIVIDSCPTCDLVWLDAGELQRVVDAAGIDRRS